VYVWKLARKTGQPGGKLQGGKLVTIRSQLIYCTFLISSYRLPFLIYTENRQFAGARPFDAPRKSLRNRVAGLRSAGRDRLPRVGRKDSGAAD